MELHTRIPAIQRRVESRTRTEAGYCEKTLFIQLFNIRKRWFFGRSDLKKSRLQDLTSFRSHLITPATNPSMKLRRLRDDIFRELFLNFFCCCCVPSLEFNMKNCRINNGTTFKRNLTMQNHSILFFTGKVKDWQILGSFFFLNINVSDWQRSRRTEDV